MILCICHGISDKTVTKLSVSHHAYELRQVRKMLPLGSQCGKCIPATKQLLQALQTTHRNAEQTACLFEQVA